MEIGARPATELFVAADVHYLASGGARAAAVVSADATFSLLVVDGYADLDPDERPGLGAHAYAEFGVPVIGVAKSAFRTATHAIPVLRGTSARPLYVTAAGMPRAEAAGLVRHMAGQHRMPDALRRVDALARHGLPAPVRTTGRPADRRSGPCRDRR